MIIRDNSIHKNTDATKKKPDMLKIRHQVQDICGSPSQEEVKKTLDDINKRYAKTFENLSK